MFARTLILFLAILSAAPALADAPIRFESGGRQTVMIELYTSEGCSSCPPAEEYLNAFVDQPGLWQRFIPLALHVDYWDYLGWRDRFAAPEHSRRQRRYAREHLTRTVYTPQFVVNGREWRPGWRRGVPEIDSPEVGNLVVTINGGQVEANMELVGVQSRPLELNLALLGMGLSSRIEAGENAGRDSRHEFVVLAHSRAEGEGGRWVAELPRPPAGIEPPRLALVAWVADPDDPSPVQATGGFISSRVAAR
jgi:hypothetical protein